ncbi:class I SAM-dependent methyltransferase [Pontibacter sp. JH31]|uniref:Class I SAM-dependent methyltransferase n=1 Tax=Pontibacter aquaedesilientis TaxID=2766980 RepID=A0ABR7XF43_9BACT|nr:class I SAM-dependent methyltransferase [Pontibacter aquaedesilientis]MBD1396919.1 class I SAM-dependent methyltransferase [Pontibacter aquaedesilientis]
MNDTNFDPIAPLYDSLARLVFGNELRRAQLAHLDAIPAQARVLLIGGGSGWLLEQLLQLRPGIAVTYLENAPKMLQMAKQRIGRNPALSKSAVTFRLGNEDSLTADEKFDVILTPFLLDLFPEQRLQHLMDRLYTCLTPNGLWLFSDFWPVQTPALIWQRLLLKSMYTFFGLLSEVKATRLPDFRKHFERLQLQELQSAPFYKGMVQAKVYQKA